MIWLDALDLPLFVYLEGSYAIESELQAQRNRPDSSQVEYRASGLAPARRPGTQIRRYPMMRYPWSRTEEALREMARYGDGEVAELDYVNPETGEDVLPTMGFTAMMLAEGQKVSPPRRSTSAVFHVIRGSGTTTVDGETIAWKAKGTFSAPVFAAIDHQAAEESFLVQIHDRPLQERLRYYEERPR